MESDRQYFARRAAEERAAASWASHPEAQRSHEVMAERYDELACAIGRREYLLGLDLYDNGGAARESH